MIFKRLGIGIGVLTFIVVAMAGCAAQSGKNPGATQVNHTSTTASHFTNSTRANKLTLKASEHFPQIVSMAMKHFPPKVLNAPKAPTLLPVADSGSSELHYRTWDITTGPILSYSVQFLSRRNRLATFSGSTYKGFLSDKAGDSVWLPNTLMVGGHATNSTVNLLSGVVAKEQVFVAPKNSAKEVSSASLKWSDGRWQFEVDQTQNTRVPIVEADTVVSYLHNHTMPLPQSRGTVFIDVYPGENSRGHMTGTNVNETIKWQEGSHVYEVDTYSNAKNPIQTGLAMAISMKPYV